MTDRRESNRRPRPRPRLRVESLEDRTVPSVYTQLDNALSELGTLEANVEKVADTLQYIPFLDKVGHQLGDLLHNAGDALITFKNLMSTLQTQLNNSNPSSAAIDSAIQSAIGNINGVTHATVNSVNPSAGEQIEIDIQVHRHVDVLNQNLSFGLPGLPIKMTGQGGVTIGATVDAELAFGLDGNGKFFWKGVHLPNSVQNAQLDDQFLVDVTAALSNASLGASVGFLNGTLKDNGSAFDVDFHVKNFDEIASVPTPTVSVNKAQIDLNASLSFAATMPFNNGWLSNQSVQLPSLTTGITIDFTNGFDDPRVNFGDVNLDLGSALESFIRPVVSVVQDILGPIEPIINLLTTPIPGLSDLSHLAGQGDVTLLAIGEKVAGAALGPEITPVIDLVGKLLPIIKDLNSIQGNGTIDLGGFDLGGEQNQLLTAPADFSKLTDINAKDMLTPATSKMTSLIPENVGNVPGIVGQADQTIKNALSDLTSLVNTGTSFRFPVLDDPKGCVFKLLLGQDADLFVFNANFAFDGNASDVSGVPDLGFSGIQLKFNNQMKVSGSFQLAYDTYGIREFFNTGNPSKLLDGFYIDEAQTFLRFDGKIGFGPQVDPFPGVEVQLAGGLEAIGAGGSQGFEITVDNPDPSDAGRVRLNTLFNGNCIFDAQGELDASLGINIRLGFDVPLVGFVGVEHDFDIAKFVLENYPQQACLGSENQDNIIPATLNGNVLDINVDGSGNIANYLTKNNLNTETFEVKHVGGTAGDENLSVTAFGITQEYDHVANIKALGAGFGFNQNVTIDAGVLDQVTLEGGSGSNELTDLGSGDAYLVGGTGPTETSNLTGGLGSNTLTGGAGADTLIGGPCTMPGSANSLIGGTGPDQLYAGPHSDDTLTGGTGDNVFFAGDGRDVMTGGTQFNTFNWGEGNGPLDVTGGPNGHNFLTVVGTTPNDQFTASQDNNGGVLVQAPGALIHALQVQTLSLDGTGGGSRYILNDLSQTPVQRVGLNLHEESATVGAADEVTINAPPTPDTVQVGWNQQLAAQGKQVTEVYVSTQLGDASGGRTASYLIDAAIPKTADVLHVNTFAGADAVRVDSTQPDLGASGRGGHVVVNTGDGDDTITVGDPNPDEGLDNFFGPLDVEAGRGHNRITFDEHSSLVHDTVTMTASQVIRSTQTNTVTIPPNPGGVPQTETGYPFVINYAATNGDFTPVNGDPGVVFQTAQGSTNLFVPDTGAAAPTEVTSDGGLLNAHDNITVGYDGQGKNPFPSVSAASTLAALRSPLTVIGAAGPTPATVLDLADKAAPVGETYSVDVAQNLQGVVNRQGAAPVFYQDLAMTLDAGNNGGSIYVPGVAKFSAVTVNAGAGTNTVTVGEPPKASPPVGRLDNMAGPLTINGGPGVTHLSINDQGTTTAQQYFLNPGQLTRVGNPAAVVDFAHLSTLELDASENGAGTNSIFVSGTPAGVPVRVRPGDGNAILASEDLDQYHGALRFDWATGQKTFEVDDGAAAAAEKYRLSNTPAVTTLQRTKAEPVTLHGPLANVQLLPGLAHVNAIDVDSVNSGTTVTIGAGLAADSVTVGGPKRDLGGIQGPLAVHGNGLTRLSLDDQNAAGGRDYQLTVSTVTVAANLPPIQFSSLGGLTLDAAPNAKAEVLATAAGTGVHLNLGGGTGKATVGAAAGKLATIQGPVTIHGRTGKESVVLNDVNGPAMNSYTLAGDSIASAASKSVHFQNVGDVTLDGGPGVEFYNVNAVGTTPIKIVGQGVDNVLSGPNQTNHWSISGANAGTLDATILFAGIQSLSGGSVNDTFAYSTAGTLTGAISGHSPSNLATIAGPNQADMTAHVDIALAAGQSVTLLDRYDAGTDSWYGAELVGTANGFVPTIYRRKNGTVTVLATGSAIASASGTLAFTVHGTSLAMALNNAALIGASDSALSSTGVGVLFGPGVSIRNFGII